MEAKTCKCGYRKRKTNHNSGSHHLKWFRSWESSLPYPKADRAKFESSIAPAHDEEQAKKQVVLIDGLVKDDVERQSQERMATIKPFHPDTKLIIKRG